MLWGVLKMMVSASIAVAVTSTALGTRWGSSSSPSSSNAPSSVARRLPIPMSGGATAATTTSRGGHFRDNRSSWSTPTVENITEEEEGAEAEESPGGWNATYGNNNGSTDGNTTEAACEDWQAPHHPLFQTANIFFAAGFLLPHSFKLSMLTTRAALSIGFLLYTLWAGIFVCAPDIFAWNLTFAFINATHVIYLACTSFPPRIEPELQDLYMKVFQPLKMDKRVFTELVKDAEIMFLDEGAHYAVEDVSAADERLSILLTGKVKVTCEDTQLHYILPNEFLDSPEWEACPADSDELYQVTVTAVEPSQYLCWQRSKLQQVLRNKPFLDAVIFNLVGKDITHKLYSLNEQINPFNKSKNQLANTDFYWRQHFPRSLSMDVVHTGTTGHVRSHLWRMHSRRASSANSDSIGSSPARASRYSHLSDPGFSRSPLRIPPVIVASDAAFGGLSSGEEDDDDGEGEEDRSHSSAARSLDRSHDGGSVSGSESAYVTAASPAPASSCAPLSLFSSRQHTPSTPPPTTVATSIREAAAAATNYGAVGHTTSLPAPILPQHSHSYSSLQSSLHVAFETPV